MDDNILLSIVLDMGFTQGQNTIIYQHFKKLTCITRQIYIYIYIRPVLYCDIVKSDMHRITTQIYPTCIVLRHCQDRHVSKCDTAKSDAPRKEC